MRSGLYNAFAFGFLLMLGYVVLFGANGDWAATGRAGVAFLGAALCALAGNADRFESLKASVSGIEAKTREVTRVVEEARVTLREFHVLAEMTASQLIEMMAAAGRFGGGAESRIKDKQRDRILKTLRTIGVSKEAIQRVNSSDRYWILTDYKLGTLSRIRASQQCSAEL